jgi:phosphoribosylanthranilate isomerase
MVDLDAARTGVPANLAAISAVAAAVSCPIQVGGGVRSVDAASRLLDVGVERVVVGTAAVENPQLVDDLCARHPSRIAVGLDVRGRTLAARGWTREGGDLYDVLARLDGEGCARYVVTDVNKDGMLQGPNLDLLRSVCAATDRPVVASGGITELADLEALSGLVDDGGEGAIIGTALYEGRFTLEDALALTRPADRP